MIILVNSDVFGKNLQNLRKIHHLSREALADLTEIHIRTLRDIEAGTLRDIESKWFRRLCGIFDITGEDAGNFLMYPYST